MQLETSGLGHREGHLGTRHEAHARNWQQQRQMELASFDWYSSIVQTACRRGGLGVTPNEASSIAAFYSVTAQYVSWVHKLPNPALWAGGQDLTQHAPWTAPNLHALRDTHARLLQEYYCVVASADVVGPVRCGRAISCRSRGSCDHPSPSDPQPS
jgi:hypothetical protein